VEASFKDRAFVVLQKCLPTRTLSALMFRIAEIRTKRFKNALIRLFMRGYPIELGEAEFERIESYDHFNAFFTRALKPGARPQPADPAALSSPVDGTLSQFGKIVGGSLIQAKGHVHMPFTGALKHWSYVPGRLFSVNPSTARGLPKLFARNERMVAIFETKVGPMAVVMVGALFVGGVETVWGGRLTPPHVRSGGPFNYATLRPLSLNRGDEMGRFHMGSTVILLMPRGVVTWADGLAAGTPLRLGQQIATTSSIRP
jgi:phosphatidylserine decarboxylase